MEPPPKKKKTAEEVLTQKKVYDHEDRTRSFQQSWLKEFPWLELREVTETGSADGNPEQGPQGQGQSSDSSVPVETVKKMFCKICPMYETSGVFVTGSTNFKKESIVYHNKSGSHTHNIGVHDAKIAVPGSSQAEKNIVNMNQSSYLRMAKMFKNAHAVARHNRPYTDFVWICKLDKAKGVDIGSKYLNEKEAAIFIHYIAEAERKKISRKFESARFMAPISDGSTDSSVTEAEILFARMCHRGVISTHFVGVKNVGKPDAQNICNAVTEMLSNNLCENWQQKIVGMATDGASVMLGCKNGVVAKIKELVGRPYIQAVHCSAHRLELSYKDACKPVDLFKKVDALLLSLYLFYRNSPLNRANLRESCKAAGMKPMIPTRVGGTRWVQHSKIALEHVLLGYGPIMEHLTQVTKKYSYYYFITHWSA